MRSYSPVNWRSETLELISNQMNTTPKALFSLFTLLSLLVVGGCDSNDDPIIDEDPGELEWNYVNKGPDRWQNIDPSWAICGSGELQSPIDISVPTSSDIGNWSFDYSQSRLRIHNDGNSIHLITDGTSTMVLDGQPFKLREVHFHTGSEHTIDGADFPGEVHFEHEGPNGEIAYVAAMIQAAEENKALTDIFAEVPDKPGDPVDVFGFFYDPDVFLPTNRTFYRYEGSLTTPPCTEGVTWVVMQKPLIMSSVQVAGLRGVMGLNTRPTFPVNGRAITQN
jgi:carbonic anhydrase